MIHGTLAHSGVMARLAESIGRPAIAFDLPGHGKGPPFDFDRDFLDQILDLAQSVIPDRPVHLFGHSFGAVAAMQLAMIYPEKFKSLILFEPVLFAATRDKTQLEKYQKQFAPFYDAMASGDQIQAAELFLSIWGGGKLRPEQLRAVASQMPIILAQDGPVFEDSKNLLVDGGLEGWTMPVLMLRGALSPPITQEVNDSLAVRIPSVVTRTIDGVGHMAPMTHPAEVAAAISEFLTPLKRLTAH